MTIIWEIMVCCYMNVSIFCTIHRDLKKLYKMVDALQNNVHYYKAF